MLAGTGRYSRVCSARVEMHPRLQDTERASDCQKKEAFVPEDYPNYRMFAELARLIRASA
jgi:hypothetical protein